MSTTYENQGYNEDFGWRRTAPVARRAAMTLYSWQDPGWSFLWGVLAAFPFLLAAALAPALLSLSPTVDMIAPIAEARAVHGGEADLLTQSSPFYLLLLMVGDLFADAPGRIHLVTKAISALLIVYPLAYLCSSRFPVLPSVTLIAGFAAYVAAPFAGAAELGLAMLLVCAIAFVSASADESGARARFEGLLAGAVLYALWLLNPVFSLAGFVLLSACPFLTGKPGLFRYAATLAVFAVFAGVTEVLSPGLNMARAQAASGILHIDPDLTGREGAMGLSAIAFSAVMTIASAAIFGGREHVKNWIAAVLLVIVGFLAARIVGANALPVFVLGAAMAVFSVASPFYDGLFRDHDRASVSIAITTAAIALFWSVAPILHAAGQFTLQMQAAKAAPENIRTELALVQPGGPTIAKWVEEGRFSTPEAREFFALAPVDQSAMLLEAASRARTIAQYGLDVAILTGADTACVLAESRQCHADGPSAASAASIVLVPRLDLDPATVAAKDRSEAMLYTDFKLIERTALWEIWARRGATLPSQLFQSQASALNR